MFSEKYSHSLFAVNKLLLAISALVFLNRRERLRRHNIRVKHICVILSETFGTRRGHTRFLLFPLPAFYRSTYIFFPGRPRSYVADVFSRFISEILSWSNFHCDLAVRYTFSYTPTCISQCHPPSISLFLFLFFPPFLFSVLSIARGSICVSLVYRSGFDAFSCSFV